MGKKPRSGFNRPFAERADALREVVGRAPAPAAPPAVEAEPEDEDEARSFAEAMGGVAPLPADPRGRHGGPPPRTTQPLAGRAREEAESYATLADLVTGQGAFDISSTDALLEGVAPGVDRRLLRKLRKAEYPLEAHLDLHGLSSEEAYAEVEQFFAKSRAAGKRCVLVIHGRGNNSKEGMPVLKARLRGWLEEGRLGRSVLAFCSARPSDGGAGALYVLLRK